MNRALRKIINNNLTLKCIACIIGMLLWLKYSSPLVQCSLEVPLSFYHVDDGTEIESLEHINVMLQAKRTDLYLLDSCKCAIHIDAQNLQKGVNEVAITEKNIYLPEAVAVLNYSPASITINVK